ncbi:MAG TPA: radical SAM protein [Vicinamibacterales bacterium]
MARVMLVQPWSYHDENVTGQDLGEQWRNGPYSLVLLGTILRREGHEVRIVDMIRDVVVLNGSVDGCLHQFGLALSEFRPDVVGFGFFSIHYAEVIRAVDYARAECRRIGIAPIFIAGGIHASTEPALTLRDMHFDHAFIGEADVSLARFVSTASPDGIPGIVSNPADPVNPGEAISRLDDLPFPDWSLVDYRFYAQPSRGKLKTRKTRSLDLMMGRGCVYKCTFCAYPTLSSVRFYSAEYLVEQVQYMHREFGIDSVYFTDSTIGNNRRLITAFSEGMIRSGLARHVEWHANIRPNQVNEEILTLMWAAGCRFLFYGFESGSQRVLDLMAKGCKVGDNDKAARLHERLGFPYHASMLLGFPGEREEDIQETLAFMRRYTPPSMGVNWYVPLPGSPDYDTLKAQGALDVGDPKLWRTIGEVNSARVYAEVPEARFRELFSEAERIANVDAPARARALWGCLAPPHSALDLPAAS